MKGQKYSLPLTGSAITTLAGILCSAPIAAQERAAGGVLEEVLVTAEKRTVNLQDVAQSVTAFTAEDLAIQNIQTAYDLGTKVPGLTINKNDGSQLLVTLRGIGREANENTQSVSGVALHIDGVFLPNADMLRADFLDVERVEVLRGPQGTVYGQQAIGGAINVISKRPVIGEFEGQAEVGVGNYDFLRPRAEVNIPISDTLALRAAASYTQRDGFSELVNSPAAGYELDDADNLAGRLRLLWQPTDDFSVILSAALFDEDIADAALRHVEDPGSNPRKLQQDREGTFRQQQKLYIADVTWDLPFATLKSVTGFQAEENFQSIDGDKGTAAYIYPQAIVDFGGETDTFTQDLNLVSSGDGPLEWIVGAFYLDSDSDVSFIDFYDFNADGRYETQDLDPFQPFFVFAPGVPDELNFANDIEGKRESWSVYGQVTYAIGERLRLTAGLRYTEDDIEQFQVPYLDTGIFFSQPVTYASSADDVTWKLAAQYDFADDVMGYLTVSTGLKPGGINSIFAPLEPTLVQAVFDGEHATSYELGIKSRFADDRVQLNAAAFLYDYEDYQFHTENFAAFTGGVSNVPEVQIYGAEFELTAFFTGSLRFDANVSLLDGEVDSDLLALDPIRARAANAETIAQGSFVGSPLNVELRTAEVGNLNGNTPAKLPPLQVFARLTHSLAIGGYGELTTSLAYTYKDEYDYTVFNTPGFETPSFDAWDLNLHYEPYEGNWYAALAVTNLEDDDNINARWAPVFGQGFTSDQFFPPRQVQARVGFRF